jgi:hypothetical protein
MPGTRSRNAPECGPPTTSRRSALTKLTESNAQRICQLDGRDADHAGHREDRIEDPRLSLAVESGCRVDDDHDGYPAGSSHTGGGTSGTSDPVYPVAIDLTTNLRIVSSPEGRNTDDT